MGTMNLTKELLKIPSPSGKEKLIGEFLVKRLRRNFKVKTQKVGNRFNILATNGKPRVILTTHIDTVPGQLRFREDNNYLYGRGACDAKGIIASMICAGEEAARLGISNFGILLDVSEETDFSGIKKAMNLVDPEVVIVGEPTDFKIVTGQKGLIGIKIKCTGKSAAGSTPEKGSSAINKLIDMLFKLRSKQLPEDKILGKTTLNIGKIEGGSAPNVVADYAEAIVEFRTAKQNQKIINILTNSIPKKNMMIDYSFDPVISKDIKFVNKLNSDKITVPYFTEMYFWSKKAKTIVFGPGKYKFAHSDDEKIRKKDLEKGKECYLNMIKMFTYNKKPYKNINTF